MFADLTKVPVKDDSVIYDQYVQIPYNGNLASVDAVPRITFQNSGLLDYLLSAGAPIACQKRNYLTKRPMLAACMSGSLPLVKWLHKHGQLCVDSGPSNCLTSACMNGNLTLIRWLLRHGCHTALISGSASRASSITEVNLFLARFSISPETQNGT